MELFSKLFSVVTQLDYELLSVRVLPPSLLKCHPLSFSTALYSYMNSVRVNYFWQQLYGSLMIKQLTTRNVLLSVTLRLFRAFTSKCRQKSRRIILPVCESLI